MEEIYENQYEVSKNPGEIQDVAVINNVSINISNAIKILDKANLKQEDFKKALQLVSLEPISEDSLDQYIEFMSGAYDLSSDLCINYMILLDYTNAYNFISIAIDILNDVIDRLNYFLSGFDPEIKENKYAINYFNENIQMFTGLRIISQGMGYMSLGMINAFANDIDSGILNLSKGIEILDAYYEESNIKIFKFLSNLSQAIYHSLKGSDKSYKLDYKGARNSYLKSKIILEKLINDSNEDNDVAEDGKAGIIIGYLAILHQYCMTDYNIKFNNGNFAGAIESLDTFKLEWDKQLPRVEKYTPDPIMNMHYGYYHMFLAQKYLAEGELNRESHNWLYAYSYYGKASEEWEICADFWLRSGTLRSSIMQERLMNEGSSVNSFVRTCKKEEKLVKEIESLKKQLEESKENNELVSRPSTETQQNIELVINNNSTKKELSMRDNIKIKSKKIGVVGSDTHVNNINFNDVWNKEKKIIDLAELAKELEALRLELKKEAKESKHDISIGNIAVAEDSAKNGDGSKTFEYLQKAGEWTLKVAEKISVPLATEALKKLLGFQ